MLNQENFNLAVTALTHARDKDGSPLRIIELRASSPELVFARAFTDGPLTVDTRSISKLITSLTLGAAIKSNQIDLSLEQPVGPLLRTLLQHKVDVPSSWDQVTVANMLSGTIGQEAGFFFRSDLAEMPSEGLLAYAFSKPITHTPGAHFAYSNVGSFLVSVILQERIGSSLSTLTNELLLGPLGIGARQWLTYANYTAACTGVQLSATDMLAVAEQMLPGGKLESILPDGWIQQMRQSRSGPLTAGRKVIPKTGYGLGLWLTPSDTYFCNGTGGQYLIVSPSSKTCVAITADCPDPKSIPKCLQAILS